MKIYSSCPVIRTETIKLWQQVQVAGSLRMVEFDRDVVWLRDSDTKLTIEHRGAVVDEGPTLNDYYGYLTSLESAATEAKKISKRLKIKRDDVLAIMATITISERPVLADDSKEGIEWNARAQRKLYVHIENDWYTSPKWSDETGYSRLRPIEVESLRVDVTNGKLGVLTKRWLQSKREMQLT